MNRTYSLVSTYRDYPGSEWFLGQWLKTAHGRAKPANIFILSDRDQPQLLGSCQWIATGGDLGNCGELLRREHRNYLPTCNAAWMAGLWLCYLAETDFIYLEQDALAFGDWVETLYSELGHRQAMFGRSPIHGVATSLFMVRHEHIPFFVRDYINEGPENNFSRIAEMKVGRMAARSPEDYGTYSFGYDTARPFNAGDRAWFAQKFTREEMFQLQTAGLICGKDMPDVPVFTNNP